MASFPSGGAARGLVAGLSIRDARQARAQAKETERQKVIRENMIASRESAITGATQWSELAAQIIQAGGQPEQIEDFRKGAEAVLLDHATALESMRALATKSGLDPEQIPSGREFFEQHISLFDASVEAAATKTATVQGEQEAEQKLSEARKVASGLGVPVSRVAEAMGLVTEDKTAALRFAAEQRINEQTQQELQTEKGLRGEVTSLLKDFNTVADSYARVSASVTDPSAAGDLSLIFNFMKMLDPNSVVRESEFATASNAGSVPQRVIASYNRVLSGERLEADQRADFVDRANRLMVASQTEAQKTAGAFENISRNAGVNPDNVLAQFRARVTDPVVPGQAGLPKPTTAAEYDALPSGTRYLHPDGRERVKP